MNEHFVCVKVDREERPDVDAIYMEAVQALTGRGGWPLNVFITPEQVPFYAGTYFPPEPRHGMPSWPRCSRPSRRRGTLKREEIREQSERDGRAARRRRAPEADRGAARRRRSSTTRSTQLAAHFDSRPRRLGRRAEVPRRRRRSSSSCAAARRAIALYTLRSMASGGIYDQIGGGFARYSIDETWTVPHFEKMLYDNALLARAYLHGWQVSAARRRDPAPHGRGDARLGAARDDRPRGRVLLSALDADSEGVEGKFYVWSLDELREVLGERRRRGDRLVRRERARQLRGREHPRVARPRAGRRAAARADPRGAAGPARERVRPGLDDKRLTAWNALMIGALAEAGAVLRRDDYLDAARRAAAFVLDEMRDGDGRLLRTYNAGEAKLNAYLEDHAFLLEALLTLYEATFEPRWFHAARELADDDDRALRRPRARRLLSDLGDHEQLVARRKEIDDAPIPSGQSSAALGLLRLAALTGEARYEDAALGVLRLFGDLLRRSPLAFGHLLQALDFHLAPRARGRARRRGHERARARRARRVPPPRRARRRRRRRTTAACRCWRAGRRSDGRAAAYVCERFACQQPVTEPDELAALLAQHADLRLNGGPCG